MRPFGSPQLELELQRDAEKRRLEAEAEAFLAGHPRVWDLFCRFAREAIAAGYEHFSSDMILHRIRWETSIATKTGVEIDGHALKLNDHLTPYLARKFHRDFPQHAGFFRMRSLTHS